MTGPAPAVIRLERTPSTMDAVHALAEAGAPTGTAVVAAAQEAGRGSRGRRWASPPGGLWLSVLARPAAAGVEVLSLRAGLAVADALDGVGLGGRIALKWPNDLMLDDLKCGGILCEARWQGATPAWVVIGLGLNVTNPAPPNVAAGRLADLVPALTPEALVVPMVAALRAVDTAAGPLDPDELAQFARRDWLHGRALAGPEAGIGRGLAPDGSLIVRRPDGSTATVRGGTVVLAETSLTAESPSCS